MRRRQAFLALWLLAALAAACAGPQGPAGPPSLLVARQLSMTLPSAAELTAHLDATQLLVIEHQGQRHLLQAYVELRPGRVALVILDRLGMFLYSIEYEGGELAARRGPGVPEAWPDGRMLADFLLVFQPLEALTGTLRGGSIEQRGDRRLRTVRSGSRTVIEIHYAADSPWAGPVRYTHFERGYSMAIETVERSQP